MITPREKAHVGLCKRSFGGVVLQAHALGGVADGDFHHALQPMQRTLDPVAQVGQSMPSMRIGSYW